MGRHRNDPRGVGQVMAIVGAVVLLVTLVALGGYFLYRSLPSNGTSVSANASEASADSEVPENADVLHVRVIGESSNVFVRVPGGDVLHDQEVRQDGSITYAEAPEGLEVTIGDPGAVEVYVKGSQRDLSERGPDYGFTISGQ